MHAPPSSLPRPRPTAGPATSTTTLTPTRPAPTILRPHPNHHTAATLPTHTTASTRLQSPHNDLEPVPASAAAAVPRAATVQRVPFPVAHLVSGDSFRFSLAVQARSAVGLSRRVVEFAAEREGAGAGFVVGRGEIAAVDDVDYGEVDLEDEVDHFGGLFEFGDFLIVRTEGLLGFVSSKPESQTGTRFLLW